MTDEKKAPKKKGWPIADRAKDMENEKKAPIKNKFYVKNRVRS